MINLRKTPTPKQRRRLLKKNAGVCCVCKQRGLGVHFHHIDGDSSNTVDDNLAVLCVKDHDVHHRPIAYTSPNHLEIGAQCIKEFKESWEVFVKEAAKPDPAVLAVVNIYGDYSAVHSARLILQWQSGKVEFERVYHLLSGPIEDWIDSILDEVTWLGRGIKLVVIDEPLDVEYCPCCQASLSDIVDENLAKKIAAESWSSDSLCSIYVNPTTPSLAILISLKQELLYRGHLHLCGDYLHYQCDKYEERVPIRDRLSVRTQVTGIVERIINEWEPGRILIGAGDPDNPDLIPALDLPEHWEHEKVKG